MGHFSLDFKKAKGSSDARESDHIERKVIPDNADPTRTHLNRELVKMPSGVYGRDEAVSHRIKTAGIKRKITNDQYCPANFERKVNLLQPFKGNYSQIWNSVTGGAYHSACGATMCVRND